jgi:hypothetical protein
MPPRKPKKRRTPNPYRDSRIKTKDVNELTSEKNIGFRLAKGFNALGEKEEDFEQLDERLEKSRHRPGLVRVSNTWASKRKPPY